MVKAKKDDIKEVKETKQKTIQEVEQKAENVEADSKVGKRLSKRKSKNDALISLDRNRVVPVVSVSNFTVGYKTKETNTMLIWNNYGDEHEMKIGEVINMLGESEKFLKQPWLIVDDEEFVEAMNLGELYDLVFDLEDLDKFFKQSANKIKEELNRLSEKMRNDVLNRAISMIYNGEINNLQLVQFLKREYKIDINI
ncbi:hypothetical protein [Clostridium sp.]|uniref:hypothetical protein n=1 Tax=Clostridium sp. TaxID=1506 RepID=UPI00290EA087|nr:hypothetical protein [Clostridium sp.]MDU3410094.1 hypothetical protein [Clostridium sp.]